MRNFLRQGCLTLGAILLLLAFLPACTGLETVSNQPAKPVASITSPQAGSSFKVGQQVVVQFSAADVKGVAQVELSINDQPLRVEKVDPPVNSFVATQSWTPDTAGSYVIELQAFNVAGDASDPAQVVVMISGTAAETLPAVPNTPTTLPPADTPTSPPTLPATEQAEMPALTPTTPATASPVSTPTVATPLVTAVVGLNVRGGPGTNYPVIGRLTEGQTIPITGRDPNGSWWQIAYPDSNGRGWVSASEQFSTASNAEGVSIVEVPATPTSAPPPTATAAPLKPTIFSFTADRYTIGPGEKVTLRWDLANAKTAYLRYDDVEEGVIAPGEKSVSPTSTTVYTLVARNDGGDTTAELTIQVTGGATATPVPVLRDGKTRLVDGQTIDFDQGIIQQGTGGAGADFYWDGQQKQFIPQDNSSGALLDRTYETITPADCRSASYGQPIRDINPASRIAGCYRTNEGRYGKFYIAEWNAAGDLTIVWLTWDYR